ncbi:hypothetical protein [Paraburkholderia caledonica]|uniref:AP2/ERF domain-containing protein n=1 Tax=Paraburkholderia caledonica TaxID=134536 RepID=A0AB73IRG6_9BURK|nr:hypothetical protein [Paraburkholderia caledonica]
MKIIYTRKGEEILVDDEDYERLNRHIWRIDERGYVVRSLPRVRNQPRIMVPMHRDVMGLGYGDPRHVDHRFGVKADNRKSELRICDNAQNHWNVGVRPDNTSGFKGVHWVKAKRKWQARICAYQKRISLGYFESAEEAHKAYCAAALRIHGEFAHTGSRADDATCILPDEALQAFKAQQELTVIGPIIKAQFGE